VQYSANFDKRLLTLSATDFTRILLTKPFTLCSNIDKYFDRARTVSPCCWEFKRILVWQVSKVIS